MAETDPNNIGSRLRRWATRIPRPTDFIKSANPVSKTIFADVASVIEQSRETRVESFSEAMRRMGRTPDELPVIYLGLRRTAFVFGTSCVVLFIAGLVTFILLAIDGKGGTFTAVSSMVVCYLMSVYAALSCSITCMRAWQVRTQKLSPFKDFVASPDNWWPVKWPITEVDPATPLGRTAIKHSPVNKNGR